MARGILALHAFVLALATSSTPSTFPPHKPSTSRGEAVIKNCSTICLPFLANAFVYCFGDAREKPHLRRVVWTDPQGQDVLPWAPGRHAFVLGNNSFLSHSYLVFRDFNVTLEGTYWCSVVANGSSAGRASIRILVSSSDETSSLQCQCELGASSRSVRRAGGMRQLESSARIEVSARRSPDKPMQKVCQQGMPFRVPEDECLLPSSASARIPRTCGRKCQEVSANGTVLSSRGRVPFTSGVLFYFLHCLHS